MKRKRETHGKNAEEKANLGLASFERIVDTYLGPQQVHYISGLSLTHCVEVKLKDVLPRHACICIYTLFYHTYCF